MTEHPTVPPPASLKRPQSTADNRNPKRPAPRFVPPRVTPAKPLVIFCHGERVSYDKLPFSKADIPVGFFAEIGFGISSWTSYDIFHQNQTPTEWPAYL